MAMRLYLSGPLTSYADRDEFQIDRVLVWVKYPANGNRSAALLRANELFPEIWQAIPEVVPFAQAQSRAVIPEFWRAHDESGVPGARLAVWGITIDPATELAVYDVFWNHDFKCPAGLPELPDGHSVDVSRDREGRLQLVGVFRGHADV